MDHVPRSKEFQGDPGVKFPMDTSASPLEIFGSFFTDNPDLIISETNW